MNDPRLPQCCSPEAFKLLERQVETIKSSDALLSGAVAIAMHQMPEVNPLKVDRQLQSLSMACASECAASKHRPYWHIYMMYCSTKAAFAGTPMIITTPPTAICRLF